MPEIRTYVVTQTRKVTVRANEIGDALKIAEAAFKHGQNPDNGIKNYGDVAAKLQGVWGNTADRVQEVNVNVERIR